MVAKMVGGLFGDPARLSEVSTGGAAIESLQQLAAFDMGGTINARAIQYHIFIAVDAYGAEKVK
jgi:hypothetical protein